MTTSRREQILNANDIKSEIVPIAAWGGVEIEIRGLTGRQREEVVAAARREDGTVDDTKVTVPLIIASAFDPETKKALFTPADLDALREKNAQALDDVAKVALRLSGMSQQAAESIRKN